MFRPIALALGVVLFTPAEAMASSALLQDADAVEDDAGARADVVELDGEAPDGDTVMAMADAEEGGLADASEGSPLPDAAEGDGGATKADAAPADVDSDAATQGPTPWGAASVSGSAPPQPLYAPVSPSTPQNTASTGSSIGTGLADGIGSAAEACGSDDSSDDGSDAPGACAGSDATPDDCAMGSLASRRRRSPFSRIVVLLVAGAAVIRRKTRG